MLLRWGVVPAGPWRVSKGPQAAIRKRKKCSHCIGNPLPLGEELTPMVTMGLLYLPFFFFDVCMFYLGFCERSLKWSKLWRKPLFPDLESSFLGVLRGENWASMEILGWSRTMKVGTEKLHCKETPSREQEETPATASRTAHHWRRDCSCPGCSGPTEWYHGSVGLVPNTAVLCPAWSLWDLGGRCRPHPFWCLFHPCQPWGRRDMGVGTWKTLEG